ncbi:MAG: 30S ribosomal protein S20 [Candidatus Azambacteria bacterium]|nr:30S ribosomal protein S20 [Candidatus Azambacteria bacterium]
MPITTSAKKALRQSKRKRVANVRSLDKMKVVSKEIRSLAQKKKLDEAKALLPRLYKAIDKAVKNNVIKKNTGARRKSRLSAALHKTATQK